jgi:hypothetical protein
MPLLQYFGWVGSFLVAALLAANWCFPAPIVPELGFDVPLDHKINIRIHTDHKWPERVVFDTRGSTLAQKADAETGLRESEPPVVEELQPLDAFAEMGDIHVKPCFRPPSSVCQAAEKEASRARSRIAVRKDLTLPNRLHKPPGKS